MFNKKELNDLLISIGSRIERPLNVYMIGGCALSFKGLKAATKDIDIIVLNQEDFDVLDKSMNKNDFKSETERETEFYLTALAVYKKEESRIDVFLKRVGKMLAMTNGMIKRAKKFKSYGKLTVHLVSNEDIFLFKSMTEREGDIYDCDRLMKEGLDYEVIYDETFEQSKEEGKMWFFWIYEALCLLQNYNGIQVSIKRRMFALVKKHWDEKPSSFMRNIGNLEDHIPDRKFVKELREKIG